MVFIDWFVVIVANLLPSGLLETGKQISHVFVFSVATFTSPCR